MSRYGVRLVIVAVLCGIAGPAAAGEIEVASALVRVIEQVDVPAQEAGVLAEVRASEGLLVKEGDLLAQIRDVEARLAVEQATTEFDIARKKAENDINIRFARKSAEVAQAELRRAQESIDKYTTSISDTELDRLRLTVERAVLEIEQAQRDYETAKLTALLKQTERQSAEERLRRRRIAAPLGGVVVQVNHHRGEWVQPGDMVIRMLRVDRLRAEGFLAARDVRGNLTGCPVTLHVDLPGQGVAVFPGKVVFVSPEIDPVNMQIQVWAEIENRDLLLRPGMRARMVIETPASGASR